MGLFFVSPFVSKTQNFSLVFAGQDPGEMLAAQGKKKQEDPEASTSAEPKKKGWCNQSDRTTMVQFASGPSLCFDPITLTFLAFQDPGRRQHQRRKGLVLRKLQGSSPLLQNRCKRTLNKNWLTNMRSSWRRGGSHLQQAEEDAVSPSEAEEG